ncbi:hypothetical protein LCGC14_3041120 [marine sediment metagenome]|uniref:Uncharacterized protein n=1 Tax=marine sediment metagenome TaxID=412755 RepID=A0A0F8WPE0_9ZZZZ
MEEREFEVGEHMLKGVYNKCMVCLKNLKVNEKIILCPIQKPKSGFANVISIPIHVKCYWIYNK